MLFASLTFFIVFVCQCSLCVGYLVILCFSCENVHNFMLILVVCVFFIRCDNSIPCFVTFPCLCVFTRPDNVRYVFICVNCNTGMVKYCMCSCYVCADFL